MGVIDRTAREEIRQRLRGLKGSGLREEARRIAEAHGVSEGTVYRYCTDVRETGRRSSKGQIRLPVQEEVLMEMKAFTWQTDCPATDVVRIFRENGRISPEITPAWFSRWLRANGFSRRQMKVDPRPCRRFEASEPGELYQVDGTTSQQFYLDDDGSVGWESSVSRNKNRPGNQKKRLEIVLCTDDNSRCIFGGFQDGKTVNHWLNVMFDAFKTKDDPRFIFHGVPREVYMDNDSIAKTTKFQQAMQALGVKVTKHKPTPKDARFSNARAKGKIERHLLAFAEKQKITRLQKLGSMKEANEFFFEYCLGYNSHEHSTTGEIPFQRWNRIRPEMLIECDDERLYDVLYRDIFERTVYRDLTLRFDGQHWQLDYAEPFLSMINNKVMIYRHPLRKHQIHIEWKGQEYFVEHKGQELRAWSEGPAHLPKTEREREIEQLEAVNFDDLKLWGFDQGVAKDVAYPRFKVGVQLDTSKIKPKPPQIARVDAMLRISRRLDRVLTTEENKLLNQILAEQVTEDEIERAIEQLTRPAAQQTKAS